jgi:hypothetical protein
MAIVISMLSNLAECFRVVTIAGGLFEVLAGKLCMLCVTVLR